MAGQASPASLQKAWDYGQLLRHLRSAAIASLIWGVISIVAALVTVLVEPIMALVGLLGFLLLAEGVWLLVDPRPACLIGEGIIFGVLGLSNAGIEIGSLLSGSGSLFWVGVGAVQLWLAWQAFARYRRDRDQFRDPPPQQLVDAANAAVKDLRSAKAAEFTNVLEISGPARLKVGLDADMALLVLANTKAAFLSPDQLDINFTEQKAPEGKRAVSVRLPQGMIPLGRGELKGTLPAEHADRYHGWLEGLSTAPAQEEGRAQEAGPTPEEFVAQARARGMSDDAIVQVLTDNGWSEDQARGLLRSVDEARQP